MAKARSSSARFRTQAEQSSALAELNNSMVSRLQCLNIDAAMHKMCTQAHGLGRVRRLICGFYAGAYQPMATSNGLVSLYK